MNISGWILLVIFVIVTAFFDLWAGMTMFNWHIATYFNLQPITMWQILGISTVIYSFSSKTVGLAITKILKDEYEGLSGSFEKTTTIFIGTLIVFFVSWLVK